MFHYDLVREISIMNVLLHYLDKSYELNNKYPSISIGRGISNDIQLSSNSISEDHGKISIKMNGICVYEDFSKNGTEIEIYGCKKIYLKNNITLVFGNGIIYPYRHNHIPIRFSVQGNQPASDIKDITLNPGLHYCKNGDFDSGFKYFEDYISIIHTNADAYFYSGQCAFKLKRYQDALVRLEQHYILKGEYDNCSLALLGKVYQHLNCYNEAANCYHILLKKNPRNNEAKLAIRQLEQFVPRNYSINTINAINEGDTYQHYTKYFVILGSDLHHTYILPVIKKLLKKARRRIMEKFCVEYSDTLKIRLVRIADGIPTGLATKDELILAVDDRHKNYETFLSIIVHHEYTHYVIGKMSNFSTQIPWWVHEGLACQLSENLKIPKIKKIFEMYQSQKALKLIDLEDKSLIIKNYNDHEIALLHAHCAVKWIEETYGFKFFIKLIEYMTAGMDTDTALSRLGLSCKTIDSGWQDWMKDQFQDSVTGRTLEIPVC